MSTKICKKCRIEKSLEDFPVRKRSNGGVSARCRECHKKKKRIKPIIEKKNYTCHICNLSTKMNIMISSHYPHAHKDISIDKYKEDLLANNGRPPKYCKLCGKKTFIPKGEWEYMDFCNHTCYTDYNKGSKNGNWIGGKVPMACTECNKITDRYESMAIGDNQFCSISCSSKYYYREENRSDLKTKAIEKSKKAFKDLHTDPIKRQKMAKIRLKQNRKSKAEEGCYKEILKIFPDAISSFLVKYYTFDIFIPSLNLLIEFDGYYWHSLPKAISLDKRKSLYVSKYTNYKLIRIKELEWNRSIDKYGFILNLLCNYSNG